MSYADEVYKRIMELPPTRPAAARSPEERQMAWNRFVAIMDSLSEEELAEDIFVNRPLNTSILQIERIVDADIA